MKKYLKGDGWYFPVENILALDTKSDSDNCDIFVKDEDGTASNGLLSADGTNSAAQGADYAEALVDEINFGKKVIIDLASVHEEKDGTAFSISKT